MAQYRVSFLKTLCDDSGHPHDCIEGIVNIRWARSQDRAVQAAKLRFKRMKKIPQWDFYADTFEVDIDQEGRRHYSGHTR